MPTWILSRTQPTSAGRVRWERLGDFDQRPVVLLHGTPSFIWRNIAPALARTGDGRWGRLRAPGPSHPAAADDVTAGVARGTGTGGEPRRQAVRAPPLQLVEVLLACLHDAQARGQ